MMQSVRFEYGTKILLYIFAACLPIWFVPASLGVEFGREVTFTVLIVLAVLCWLLSILIEGKLEYLKSPILYASGLLLVLYLLGTFFSKAPLVSALFADPTAEKLSTAILGIVVLSLITSVLKTTEEIGMFILTFVFAGAVAGVISFLQLFGGFSIYQYVASAASAADFNVVGTVNGLSLLYAVLFLLTVGLLSDRATSSSALKGWVKWLLLFSLVVFAANIFLINFRTAWIVLLGSGIFLFGFVFRRTWRKGQSRALDWRYAMTLGIIVVSIFMILVGKPLIKNLNLPAEVSPSLGATLGVAQSVFKESPKAMFLGDGPGLFGLEWARFKDPSINGTVFWSVRFNQGYSWIATLVPTLGVLGFLSFLLFIGATLYFLLKKFLLQEELETSLSTGTFLAFISLLLIAFVYPANFTLVMAFFTSIGLLLSLLSDEERGFWAIARRNVAFDGPWTLFLTSLVSIFFVALGISALYMQVGRVRAALAMQNGVNAFNQEKLDSAIGYFESAKDFEPNNYRSYSGLTQIRTEKIRRVIQQAASGQSVQQEFQNQVSAAVRDSQAATGLFPAEPILWRTQGVLYEIIIPFIQGSERLAFDSYKKAAELDPTNPATWADLGRAYLLFADKLQLAENQAGGNERARLDAARMATLKDAANAFEKSGALKPDFAQAHFLLTQALLRLGNINAAIASSEKTREAAPFDIGVAFQLGLLYYQNNDLVKAEAEFNRAVSLNQNYANARYFLGLIYDRQGQKEKAIKEFESIAVFNPDNKEVKDILANLRAGKSALRGIVPPDAPPEKRKEAPVK